MENNNKEVKTNELNTDVNNPTKVVPIEYTKEELDYRSELITMCSQARDDRESSHPEFDDMTYSQYYDTNKKATNQ